MSILEIVKMVFPLLLLMGALGIVLWYVKRFSLPKGKSATSAMGIKIISSQALMPKKQVTVIQIKDKYLVLGVSDSSISLLKEFEAEEEITTQHEVKESESFFEIFKRNLFSK